MINKKRSGIKSALVSLMLLFLLSACGENRNQSSVYEWGDAGRSDSDSLLFIQYSEQLTYHYSVRSDSILWYIDELMALAKRNNKQLEVMWLTASKAFTYMNAGEYALAQEYYSQAFELVQNPEIENHYWTLGNDASPEKRRLRFFSNLHFTYGHLMYLTENSEERLNQYRIANRIAVENNDIINEAYTSDGLAMAYLEKNEPDSALIYINRSIELSERLPSRFYYSFAKWIQGNIYMNLEAFDNAYGSYSSGMHSAQSEKNYQGLLINYLGLSRYFYHVNNPDSSLYYAYKTIGDGSVSDFQALRFDIGVAYENLHRVYKLRDEPINALNYLELAKTTRDSLNELRIQNLASFQQNLLNQQLEQKEREREQESIQARNRVIGILVVLFFMIIVALILYCSYKLKLKANQRLDVTNKLLIDSLGKLTAAQDQLVQQEKLASLGQLTAGIAHEIKNPLNFVNNFSEVSLEMIDEALEELATVKTQHAASQLEAIEETETILKDIETNLRKIHEHGSRADGIVKSMLLHSRGGSGKKEPANLNALVKEYVNLAFHGMRAGKDPINVDIQMDLDDSIGQIPMIAEDFSRVILNLCNNAFDAMRGKTVNSNTHVETQHAASLPGVDSKPKNYSPQLSIRTKKSGDGITIEIEDNGPGIPDDIKDKILQPFFTTKKGTQGTGLGLSITNDIVKAHGGFLEIASKSKEYTIFTIKLLNI